MNLEKKYNKKDVLILGFGKTGKSLIEFLRKLNAYIYIWDDNINLKNLNFNKVKIFNILEKKLTDFCTIFVSPGIRRDHIIIQKALKKKILINSDIELFWENKEAKYNYSSIVGITGTNGKSTIALMISRVLKTKPLGNFGNPILDYNFTKNDNFVVELSSFQLDYIIKFQPKISIISNIDVDHLNYHKTFKKYFKAKLNICKNQVSSDFLILNYDDKNIKNYFNKKNNIKARIIKVSRSLSLKNGIIIKDNVIYDNVFTHKKYNLKENNFLYFKHNQLNFAISFISLLILGLKPELIINRLSSFKGLTHRLEFIGVVNKIEFYNDSKATNIAATCSAINSFKKVILIAGGSDKGDNFNILKKYSNKIIKTYLFGETANKIAKSLNNLCSYNICENLQEAVEKSYQLSIKSEKFYPILFSPACASFDLYSNFEKRGNHFKSIFNKIKRKAA